MTIIKNIIVAFSMYSKIPMPIFKWEEKDTRYAIAFLTLVGAVIGAAELGVFYLERMLFVPDIVRVLIWMVIPLLITGGFHVDGFMDVQDALKSYKSPEEKQAILKDPHIGAFAVISLAIYGLLYMASVFLLFDAQAMYAVEIVAVGFIFIRAVGAWLSLSLRHSKKSGMLHEETKAASTVTKVILFVSIVICIFTIISLDLLTGAAVVTGVILFVLYFKHLCYKEFAGASGDTIGYFITVGELIVVMISACVVWFLL